MDQLLNYTGLVMDNGQVQRTVGKKTTLKQSAIRVCVSDADCPGRTCLHWHPECHTGVSGWTAAHSLLHCCSTEVRLPPFVWRSATPCSGGSPLNTHTLVWLLTIICFCFAYIILYYYFIIILFAYCTYTVHIQYIYIVVCTHKYILKVIHSAFSPIL